MKAGRGRRCPVRVVSGRYLLRDYLQLRAAGWVSVGRGDGQIIMQKKLGARPLKPLVFVEQRAKA